MFKTGSYYKTDDNDIFLVTHVDLASVSYRIYNEETKLHGHEFTKSRQYMAKLEAKEVSFD